jgi:hypothetical protein
VFSSAYLLVNGMACIDKSFGNSDQAFCMTYEKRSIVFELVCKSVQELYLGFSFKVYGDVTKENAIEHAADGPFLCQVELFEMNHIPYICPDFYPASFCSSAH